VVVNGKEAVDAVEKCEHDLVLMDCQMPVMSCLEATQRIREAEKQGILKRTTPIPIVALTANAMKGDAERCLAAGMTDYVSKPLDPTVLVSKIDACLEAVEALLKDSTTAPANPVPEATPVIQAYLAEELPVIDEASLVQRCLGDRGIAAKIVRTFAAQLPEDYALLEARLIAQDMHGLCATAHAVKGAAGNTSAERVRELATQLESCGYKSDLPRALVYLEQLRRECDRFAEQAANFAGVLAV
jgi:CheY-like chemotaxis protein